MVRCGLIDPNDLPTPQQPLLAACPRCSQRDGECESCGGRGTFRIESDPRKDIPSLAYRVAQFADMYLDNGLPIVAGGSLDQSSWFVSAASFCVSDRKRIIEERYGKT